jgi:hypothetical protein
MVQNIRPRWWQLYLSFPLLIGLFLLEHRLDLSGRGHQIVQIGILLVVFGSIFLWLNANSKALSAMDRRQYYDTVIVTRVAQRQFPAAGKQPALQFRTSELRGVLSDTFEMDYIDAEFISLEETAQDLKKE